MKTIIWAIVAGLIVFYLVRRVAWYLDNRRGDYLPEFDWDRRKEDENG